MGAENYLRVILALGLVLALLGAFGLLLRRFGPHGGGRRSGRRLRLVETLVLDPRRRLALIERDGVQHLLLLGNGHDQVIETGIVTPADDAAASKHSHAVTAPLASPASPTRLRRVPFIKVLKAEAQSAAAPNPTP
jgi:flagellar protein FliO/FliZ